MTLHHEALVLQHKHNKGCPISSKVEVIEIQHPSPVSSVWDSSVVTPGASRQVWIQVLTRSLAGSAFLLTWANIGQVSSCLSKIF